MVLKTLANIAVCAVCLITVVVFINFISKQGEKVRFDDCQCDDNDCEQYCPALPWHCDYEPIPAPSTALCCQCYLCQCGDGSKCNCGTYCSCDDCAKCKVKK